MIKVSVWNPMHAGRVALKGNQLDMSSGRGSAKAISEIASQNSTTAIELAEWRNSFTIKMAKAESRNNKSNWTVGILCSGGCLDTLASIRAGFVPIYLRIFSHETKFSVMRQNWVLARNLLKTSPEVILGLSEYPCVLN